MRNQGPRLAKRLREEQGHPWALNLESEAQPMPLPPHKAGGTDVLFSSLFSDVEKPNIPYFSCPCLSWRSCLNNKCSLDRKECPERIPEVSWDSSPASWPPEGHHARLAFSTFWVWRKLPPGSGRCRTSSLLSVLATWAVRLLCQHCGEGSPGTRRDEDSPSQAECAVAQVSAAAFPWATYFASDLGKRTSLDLSSFILKWGWYICPTGFDVKCVQGTYSCWQAVKTQ